MDGPPLSKHPAIVTRGAARCERLLYRTFGRRSRSTAAIGRSSALSNGRQMLANGMAMYGALYAWCRSLQAETNNWTASAAATAPA